MPSAAAEGVVPAVAAVVVASISGACSCVVVGGGDAESAAFRALLLQLLLLLWRLFDGKVTRTPTMLSDAGVAVTAVKPRVRINLFQCSYPIFAHGFWCNSSGGGG